MLPSSLAAPGIIVLSWVLALAWLRQAIEALRGIPTLPDLTLLDASTLPLLPSADGPDLAVIVPARNEEDSIQATLRSLLASTGLRLEIIAVDDRSTDSTGELMDAIAAEATVGGRPHRLHVIHNRELPAGWMGKPHALSMGAERASAPWLLFTDGDVAFHPQALALALGFALAEKTDHLVLKLTMPDMGNAETAVLMAILALAQWNNRLWKISDPRAKDFFGQGGFNLVRRDVYEALGGFEALRMEVTEDLRLGWKVKRAGYRQRLVVGEGLASIRWMTGPLSIVGLLEKNTFAALRFRTGLALLATLGLALHIVLPLAALAMGGWATAAGLLTYVSIALTYRAYKAPMWLAICFAPATAIFLFAIARSTILTLARDGVEWRGTRYPLEELRRNAGRGW
jgi:cellulose synthase/poly-beta-1,6-N-acetylglucosamine synthase-like glycosyltransferase